jgi:signal transduction histidine kinase
MNVAAHRAKSSVAITSPLGAAVAPDDRRKRRRAEMAAVEAGGLADRGHRDTPAAHQEAAAPALHAERGRRVVDTLHDVTVILSSGGTPEEALNKIASEAARVFGSQAVAVCNLSNADGQTTVQATFGVDLLRIQKSQSISLSLSSLSPGALYIVDATNTATRSHPVDPQSGPPRLAVPLVAPYQALCVVPIGNRGEVDGAIVLYETAPRIFSTDDQQFLAALGDLVALISDNGRRQQQAGQAVALAERCQLARDLHDAVIPAVFSANLIAESLPRVWTRDPAAGWRGIEELHQLTQGALAEMRALLLGLRPAAPTNRSLADLLRQLTDTTTSRAHMAVTLTIDGEAALPPNVQLALYRIAQEALNNVARHAGASHLALHLCSCPTSAALRIADDGRGFDPGAIQAGHVGLQIMHERADSIGATFALTSEPERGTQILVQWHKTNRRNSGD